MSRGRSESVPQRQHAYIRCQSELLQISIITGALPPLRSICRAEAFCTALADALISEK